ncbi:hypothetical protein AAES_131414 [Amazona aestiva]|uniref:Uncharacterized protein n=1 Tax=Amazona aestiva TaxID=12930 RepID=A0A0Q3T815_AMAAE|nr:hypothetical protein AAES_131414 [Amazona aestiva]
MKEKLCYAMASISFSEMALTSPNPEICQQQFAASRKKTSPAIAATRVQVPQAPTDFSGVPTNGYSAPVFCVVITSHVFSSVARCTTGEARSTDAPPCRWWVMRLLIPVNMKEQRHHDRQETPVPTPELAESLIRLLPGLSQVNGRGCQ